ncbi:ImmA/IrrE family metallo-endopeptidase [Sphingomonas sp. ID1715]|nr:ImmA/IrrE family metallo-endopeptidase [Sphingomonas sp. ID1715]
MGLDQLSPLCPWELCDHLGLIVLSPAELPLAANDLEQLTVKDPDSWSGLTIRSSGLIAVIVNPAHPKSRQRNTLMHEVSHVRLKHVGNRVDVSEDGILLVSDFSQEQEEEANWLAGALLAPREALLAARKAGRTPAQICQQFGISSELCLWRLRMTGVEAQMGYSRSRR